MSLAFTSVSGVAPRRSSHHFAPRCRTTCDFGQLIPILALECLPNDSILYEPQMVVRLEPTIAPIMDEIYVRIESFFVPNRLIDDNWQDYITGGEDGNDDYKLPLWDTYFKAVKDPTGKLWDYMGYPTNFDDWSAEMDVAAYNLMDDDRKRDIVPIDYKKRAYNLIWNEYYRDQNVQSEIDIVANEDILSRCWTKNDIFTSALPSVLRGTPAAINIDFSDVDVNLSFTNRPITYSAPHQVGADSDYPYISATSTQISPFNITKNATDMPYTAFGDHFVNTNRANPMFSNTAIDDSLTGKKFSLFTESEQETVSGQTVYTHHTRDLLSNVTGTGSLSGGYGISASDIRLLMQSQKYLERNMRCGSRYVEQLLARFGVHAGDYRLQRPEFVGSAKAPVLIDEIPQTSRTITNDEDDPSPQGRLAGRGVAGLSSRMSYHCQEHGYFITLASIVPRMSFASQAVPRIDKKKDKFSYYTPEYAHLTEQPLLKSDIYFGGGSLDWSTGYEPFGGYTGIYNEYRYVPDMVTGQMRRDFSDWHLARFFTSQPVLNSDFLSIASENTDTGLKRIFAVPSEPGFKLYAKNNLSMKRIVGRTAEPGLVDHF